MIQLRPNLVNVIAREARLTVDLRNTDDELLAQAEAQLSTFLQDLTSSEGVTIGTRRLARTPAVRFDARLVQIIEDVATKMGHAGIRRMTSGAGHDAQMMARICPAAMIFVPSVRGISHNPAEHTEPDDLELGANVLMRVIERVANE
jgi:N-carbamoyl-L-amino-acid hydrolase